MHVADFDYELPNALIARFPPPRRRDSRLLVVDAPEDRLTDRRFRDLPGCLRAGDLLVMNDTRVIKARLRGRKPSGGAVEMLIERLLAPTRALAQVRASKAPKAGSAIELPHGAVATVTGRDGDFFELAFSTPIEPLLERAGEVPLPPYLGRAAEPADGERYQTVFARHPGAVAAPTAGLHFDERMLQELAEAGIGSTFITLHVGAGTFQPLRCERVADNRLHAERVIVGEGACAAVRAARAAGGRVVAVGTTAVRALESASASGELAPFEGESELFIVPGYRFRSVDCLVTNFHLPRSSLLMLVAAFAGRSRILGAYRHAVAAEYRFFSYGDAMLVIPGERETA
ncbi:MAG TPA: tRNA preQ1(34) S-adenosylmethionine ribosyltransferase-isomerase QueA [Woeseiaceae bacterium]|nr:tRNA preQ1(34) S-adenosylmethionine ribosyltransferase-isomerase QueA [Woeseiaceae bacterium]